MSTGEAVVAGEEVHAPLLIYVFFNLLKGTTLLLLITAAIWRFEIGWALAALSACLLAALFVVLCPMCVQSRGRISDTEGG